MMEIKVKKEKKIAYIGIELANKAREVVVFEVIRKQILSKISSFPHNKGCAAFIPR